MGWWHHHARSVAGGTTSGILSILCRHRPQKLSDPRRALGHVRPKPHASTWTKCTDVEDLCALARAPDAHVAAGDRTQQTAARAPAATNPCRM